MVIGLDKFKEYFEKHSANYVIIGGTACDIIIDEAGFTPRATNDIDIILLVEALSNGFVEQFWQFIKDGEYSKQERSSGERKYYRFMKPQNKDFPKQIELFSRKPDLILLKEPARLTPIPADDDLSSLSAILLSDEYYNYIIDHSILNNGTHIAKLEALICLKAKAYLDLTERKAKGEKIDEKNIKKHKTDIFRLAVMVAENDIFSLPQTIKTDLQAFTDAINNDLPDKSIFKAMGLGIMDEKKVYVQLIRSFDLNNAKNKK